MRLHFQHVRLWILALLLAATAAACAYVTTQQPPVTTVPPPKSSPRPTPFTPAQQRLDITLPTANQFLFDPARQTDFYQPIESDDPDSGQYGCVRGDTNNKFHEGIDIRCLQRDKRGEPLDPILSIADGTVAYVNPLAGESNYGIYIVVRHRWGDAELYSLYAHLASVARGIQAGATVRKGQTLGVMGRTSTDFKGGIPKERAHIHLEICIFANPNFAVWAQRKNNKPIEHGVFNGNNFYGLDPAAFILAARNDSTFTVRRFLDAQKTAFTVLFDAREPLPLLTQNPWLLRESAPRGSDLQSQLQIASTTQAEPTPSEVAAIAPPIVAFEVAFDYSGFPLRIVPRRGAELSEVQHKAVITRRLLLAGVNEPELAARNCRGLVKKEGNHWTFTTRGNNLMEMLSFAQ